MKNIDSIKHYTVSTITSENYDEIATVWENSVRATHHFLLEEDILFFRPLIVDRYLGNLKVYSVKIDNKVLGFIGIDENKIEMLFVSPEYMGRGIGKFLLQYAITVHNCNQVDVNEQNNLALQFYKKNNFSVVDRSETDGAGKPYPLLHLKYTEKL